VYISSAYRKLRKQAKAENGKFDHETDLIEYVLKKFESKESRLEDDVLSSFLSKAKWTLAYSNYRAGSQK
jgi:peptidyl-tRNA hydrolase